MVSTSRNIAGQSWRASWRFLASVGIVELHSLRKSVVPDADILDGFLEGVIERGPSGPTTTGILPVALVFDTHANLEFDIHLLDLDLEIG